MAPWTRVSLGTLKRLEGDEDLAPRVLAIAISEKVVGGACIYNVGSDGVQMEGCSGLAPLWHLFEVQMTGLKRNVEFIMFKNGCQGTVLIFAAERLFRNRGSFSQRRGIFAAHSAAVK